MKKVCCDRCGEIIPNSDEYLIDTLQKEYPYQDICPQCDIALKLAASLVQEDMIRGEPPTTALQRMAELYGIVRKSAL